MSTLSAHEKLVFAVSLVLRDRRELLSISQSDLARKSGLHRSYIGDLERGFRNLSLKNLSRLSSALDMVPSKLLTLAEKKMVTEGMVKPTKAKTATKVSAKKSAVKSSRVVKTAAAEKVVKTVKAINGIKASKLTAKKPVKATVKKTR